MPTLSQDSASNTVATQQAKTVVSAKLLAERLQGLLSEAATLDMPRTVLALRTALMHCGFEGKTVDAALGEGRDNCLLH